MAKKLKKSIITSIIVLVLVISALVIMLPSASAAKSVSISGPTEVDEGVSTTFTGTISGYGTGTPAGYTINDKLSEPWIDVAASFTNTILMTYAYYSSPQVATLNLPFAFNFWGVQYPAGSTIWVASNGLMDFGTSRHTYRYNYNIPSTSGSYPNNAAYVHWDTLTVRSSATSYVCSDGGVATVLETSDPAKVGRSYLAIEWHNVYIYSYSSGPGTFEIVLWDDNDIDMRYKSTNFYGSSYDDGRSATIGLENKDGTIAAKYSYNTKTTPFPVNIRYSYNSAGGTGYEWKVDGNLVNFGYVLSDPYNPILNYAFPDGPALSTLELIVTLNGVPISGATDEHEVTVNNLPPEVYGDGTYADNYAGSSDSVFIGDWIYFHGHIRDVPADTPSDWAPQQWVEVTPGSEGVEWEVTPYTGQYAQYWEYNWEIKFLRPGQYTATVYVEDKDGGIGSGSDRYAPRTVVVKDGSLEVIGTKVVPGDAQAGGMAMAYIDIRNNIPDPDVQLPLNKEDLELVLPDGWEVLNIEAPVWMDGDGVRRVVAAISTAPGTPTGEYNIYVEPIPYSIVNHWHDIGGGVWWCGDDALGTYNDNWLDALKYEDVFIDVGYLKLHHYIQSDYSYDGGNVQISTDDGSTWQLLEPLRGYDGAISSLAVCPQGWPGFASDYGYTAVDYFDMSAYYGTTVDIQMMFGSGSSGHNYDGWYIYEVSLVDLTFTTSFFDDFSAGTGNWDTDDEYGILDYYQTKLAYSWIDIVNPANDLGIDEDYPNYIKSIPYSFNFYGQTYTNVEVTAYGYLILGRLQYVSPTYSNNGANYQFPSMSPIVRRIIAPFFDDLSPGSGWGERGKVYSRVIGSKLIVTYDDIQHGYTSSTHYTFQVVLDNSDGSIIFSYKTMTPPISSRPSPTVGLNADEGVRYELYYYRHSSYPYPSTGTFPFAGTTIKYTPGPTGQVKGWQITPAGMITDSLGRDYMWYFDTYLTLKNGVYLDPSADLASLEFDHMYELDSGDRLWVEVSMDGGPWEAVALYGYYDVTVTPGYPTTTEHVYIDLAPYLGGTILIRFHLDADTYRSRDGWYIDNVKVSTADEDPGAILAATDPRPTLTVSILEKMKSTELADYRHSQNAMRELVTLYLNLEDGMPDDGSLNDALSKYWDPHDFVMVQAIAADANENGNGYGYWSHEGGYGYFFNPGKNGNGMAGLTGKEAMN